MKTAMFRPLTLLFAAISAVGAQASLLTFEGQNSGVSVGDTYLASDGVSFVNGEFLTGVYTAPSPSGVLFDESHNTITMNSIAAPFITSVDLYYSSNSIMAGSIAWLSVYSGLNGAGTLLGTHLLTDTTGYAEATLPFSGQARSLVLTGAVNHISYDNLSFTAAPVPEPSALAALGLGALAFVRRRKA